MKLLHRGETVRFVTVTSVGPRVDRGIVTFATDNIVSIYSYTWPNAERTGTLVVRPRASVTRVTR